ncbi:putative lysine methyltransferase, S-adenosyl-L-methionine-dependent methyltransferase [Plasmopara halstedii]
MSNSGSDDDFFGCMESEDLFSETLDQQEKRREAKRYAEQYAERKWGLAARQQRIQGMDKDMVIENAIELNADKLVVFRENEGQQAKVWDCALALAKILANSALFPPDFFLKKRVIELGCGIGVPGLATAALGAEDVVLTDMPIAVPWIQANIERNYALGCIAGRVCAQGLMWGENHDNKLHSFDIILCSDLIYGHRDIAKRLVQTIVQLSHADTLIVSAHEARFAGDRGLSFFELLSEKHFTINHVPSEHLDAVYSASNIYINLIRPPQT